MNLKKASQIVEKAKKTYVDSPKNFTPYLENKTQIFSLDYVVGKKINNTNSSGNYTYNPNITPMQNNQNQNNPSQNIQNGPSFENQSQNFEQNSNNNFQTSSM